MFTELFLAAGLTSVQSGNWSATSTWDTGSLPTQHDSVEIADGHTVTYDTESEDVLDLLTVNGVLEFSRTTDTLLTVDEAAVYGTWEMGTAADPIPRSVSTNVMITGQTERIGVYNGIFTVQGADNDITWTRLAKTAKRDTRTLKLKEAVDWHIGDKVIIASTNYEGSEAEIHTIADVSTDGKTITLASTLAYKHFGANREYAEVGLLSHNILFSGDEEYDAGHIIFNGESTITIASAQFDTLGTYATLAQYPLHFHMMEDYGIGSSIKKVSITNSSNRCITVHGTNGVIVRDNVTYNTKGHCYFMEDGVEQDNKFIHNLGVYATDGATIETDTKPAIFWITNPQNTYKRNSAAGSEGIGFWFFLLDAPTGMHEGEDLEPDTLPLQSFERNTAHGHGRGLTIDGEGFASAHYSPSTQAVFKKFKSYKNDFQGVWARGTDLVFDDATLIDNRFGAIFAASDTSLTNSLVIGNSGNNSEEGMPYRFGFGYYDGPVSVTDTIFRKFRSTDDQIRAALTLQPENPFSMSPDSTYENLTFDKATKWFIADVVDNGDKFAVITNTATSDVILPVLDFHYFDGCDLKTKWNVYQCPWVDYGRLIITDTDQTPTEFSVTRLDNNKTETLTEGDSSTNGRYIMNLPINVTYRLSSGNSDGLRLRWDQADGTITVRVPYAQEPDEITEFGQTSYDWEYDTATHEVVLELEPNREYIIYE